MTLEILFNARNVLIQSTIWGLFTRSLAKFLYREPLFDEFINKSLLSLSKNIRVKSKLVFTSSLILPHKTLLSFFLISTIKLFLGLILT